MLITTIAKINKHGSVILDATFDDMKAYHMDIGDIVTISTDTGSWDMPVGTSFTDVDSGYMLCRFDLEDCHVSLCITNGSFAQTCGIAEKKTIAEGSLYEWKILKNSISLTLKEKGGYADEYSIRNLVRTDVRSDYLEMSDENFANFRCLSFTGIKSGILYRSSSPLDARLGRSNYAMVATENARIKTILNLTDSRNEMYAYESWKDSYYSACTILNGDMGYEFSSELFAGKVKDSVLFLNENEGPYLIHCKEGKDRTGVLCAILECYAGASYQEVLDDYMQSYKNFYHVKEGTETYDKIVHTDFDKILGEVLNVTEMEKADLQKVATNYLLRIGLSGDDLLLLQRKIMTP